MKIVPPTPPPPPPCSCSVCSRSPPRLPQLELFSSKASFTPRAPAGPTPRPDTPLSRTPSSSKRPYSPSKATLLPPELLTVIFFFTRPPLPEISLSRQPLPPSWSSFVRLSLVHASWTAVAQRELARVVLIRSEKQSKAFGRALEAGRVRGSTDELMFEIKDAISGSAGERSVEEQRDELVRILRGCGARLTTIRLRGFGDPALLEVNLFAVLAPHLPLLRSLEYAPIDSSAPPTTMAIFGWLRALPGLEELIVTPNVRTLAPLEGFSLSLFTELASTSTIIPLSQFSSLADSTPTMPPLSPLQTDINAETQIEHALSLLAIARLHTLTLSSVALSSPTLRTLLSTSFATLQSLTLTSTLLVGPAAVLLTLLIAIVPQLRYFEWEDRLSHALPRGVAVNLQPPPPARRLAAPGRNPATIDLTAEEYWSVISACRVVKSLKLFGDLVFEGRRAQEEGWELPKALERLSIGSRGEVGKEELEWWLDRVLQLVRGGEVGETMSETEELDLGLLVEVEARKKRRRVTWSSSTSGSLLPPSPCSTTTRKTRRLNSNLQQLCIWTTETSLRDAVDLQDKVQEIVRSGVAVVWWEMKVVVLETLELTRELRAEMLMVERGEEGEGV